MAYDIHFISGLPRSGSTLLGALLRQNPRFRAGMSGPMAGVMAALQKSLSPANEFALEVTDAQRHATLRAAFDGFYSDMADGATVFDTNRLWCAKLPALAELFPAARVIACVRDVPWVLDSLERVVRDNPLLPSGLFSYEPAWTMHQRIEQATSASGVVGFAWNALKEAVNAEQSDRLMLLRYETLTTRPAEAMAAVYDFVGAAPFAHDFENVSFDAEAFDRRLGAPGLHRVHPQVRPPSRRSVLPPDLFSRHIADSFWMTPALNPRGVPVV